MSKEELIQQIYIKLQLINDLQVTEKERLSIAKHIAKMSKSARIAFLNALSVLTDKAMEYDWMETEANNWSNV